MSRLLRQLGGWRGLLGIAIASELVGLQVGFIVGGQLAKAWSFAESLPGRVLVMGIGWLLLLLWGLWER